MKNKESERGITAVFIITAIVIFIAIFLVVALSVNVLELWGVL
jgi:hypothetical protein